MSYYIQVGMKNKKYFLAIFPFITIFGGNRERRGWGREKEERGRIEEGTHRAGDFQRGMFQSFRDNT
jgi:hypothetical protein